MFDTHIHLDLIHPGRDDHVALGEDYRALIPGIEPAQVEGALERFEDAPHAIAAAVHPWYLGDADEPTRDPRWAGLVELAHDPRIAAIGETGLDHYHHEAPADRARAERWFRAQIALAREVDKPMVLHVVRAHGATLDVLRAECAAEVGGIVHAFSGSVEVAAEYQALGFAVGIGAAVTRGRSKRVRQAASQVDAEWLVLETDAPFMAVDDGASGDGAPSDIRRVAEEVAALRGGAVVEKAAAVAARVLRR